MSNINKIAELISQKQGNPLKELLYNKFGNFIDVGKYMHNNNIQGDVPPVDIKNFDDVVNYGRMGLNNFSHDLTGFINDPSSIKDTIMNIKDNPEYISEILSTQKADEAKAGLTASALLALLLGDSLINDEEDEEYNF
jgi:hypothetical protein